MLEKSLVPVNFEGSLDQKKDFKVQMPGTMQRVENAVRLKASRWDKRSGFTSLGTTISHEESSSANVTSGRHLATYGDALVLLGNNSQLLTYSPAANVWDSTYGVVPAVAFETSTVVTNGGNVCQPDIAYTPSGFYGLGWIDETSFRQAYAVVDASSGAFVQGPRSTPFGATGLDTPINIKVASTGNTLFFVYADHTGTLRATLVDTASPTTSATYTIAADFVAGPFDIADANGAIAFVYNNAANGLTMGYLLNTGALGNGSNGFAAPVTIPSGTSLGLGALSICVGIHARVFVASFDSATANRVFIHGFNGATTSIGNLVEAVANVRNITLVDGGSGTTSSVDLYYEIGNPATMVDASDQAVHTANASWGGSGPMATSVLTQTPGIALGSKLLMIGGNRYIILAYESALQATYYLYNGTHILGRFLSNVGGGLSRNGFNLHVYNGALASGLPNFCAGASGLYSVPMLKRQQTITSATGVITQLTTGLVRYDMNLTNPDFYHAELGARLNVAGGALLTQHDGVFSSELGFHQFPEDLALSDAGVTGGSTLVGGAYVVREVFEWIDGRGDIHQSAPCPAASITVAAGHSINVDENYTTFLLGEKFRGTATFLIAYMSKAGQPDTLYRMGQVVNLKREPTGSEQILYTTGGGVFNNIIAPAARCMVQHKNRLFLGGLETDELAYSEEYSPGRGLAFHDEFRIPIESTGGRVYALGELDSFVFVFKADRIYYLSGDGPNRAGQGDTYSEPVRLPFDVGTVYPNSVITTPRGTLFKSAKGWYMVDRGLQVRYVGDQVEDFNSLTVSSATIIKSTNEVRFTHSDGSALIYNYYFGQWCVFTNYTAVGSAVANGGTFYHLKSDGTVNKETVGTYNDNGTVITMALETSWLALARLQGYQRIYSMTLLADFLTNHHLKFSLAYDYETAYNQITTVDTRNFVTTAILQFQLHPAIQKCEAIKLRIEDVDDITGGGGASLRPNAITLEVGRKRGTVKLPATKKG